MIPVKRCRNLGNYEDRVNQLGLEKILDKAVKRGASYADTRFQSFDNELISVENKVLESYSSRRLSGVGIRISIKGSMGYASTSDLTHENLERTLDRAVKAAKAVKGKKRTFRKTKINKTRLKSEARINPFDVSPEEKVSIVLEANKAAWTNEKIKSASTRLGLSKDFRFFLSSEGAEVNVETTLVGLAHISVAQANGVMEWVPYSESKCAGFEFVKCTDWNEFAVAISGLAVEAVTSKTPPPGTYPVVVDPDIVGVLLHEAFGHASEGDLVSTGESVLNKKIGTRLASENVTIVDEGVVEGGYYYPYDDEGTEKERTIIVQKGILKNFIHDRESALQLDAESTGNGRAQDFENMPIVRQTNYSMQPGDCKLDELVEDIDSGVYIRGKGMSGGEVEVGMGTFTFNVGPSRIIRKGELAETVRGVVISGLILETLKTIDAIGKDFEMKTSVFGGCGKMGQRASVGFGGPHMRVRKMTVGGR
jgi:TldD protein